MAQKSLESKDAKTLHPDEAVKERRGFLRFLALFGIGGGVGMTSGKAQAGLLDSLLSIVKKLLKAAVAGIALFYAWRFLMHSGESIKNWITKQLENDKKNNQDDTVIQAKFADYVNMGESVIENAEIVAMYDTPDDGCDLMAMGTVSASVSTRKDITAKKIAAEVAMQEDLVNKSPDSNNIVKTKVDNIRANAPAIRKNADLFIGRRGFLASEKGQMTDLLQTLMGNIHDSSRNVDNSNMDTYGAKQYVRTALSEIYSRRVKNPDIVQGFIDAQTADSAKELAKKLSVDGLSHVDLLNFNAQQYGLNPYNIFVIQSKPHPTPIYKKMLHVKAAQNSLVQEYTNLVKMRKQLVALQSVQDVKREMS